MGLLGGREQDKDQAGAGLSFRDYLDTQWQGGNPPNGQNLLIRTNYIAKPQVNGAGL